GMSFQKLSLACGIKQTTLKYVFTEKTANPSFEFVIKLALLFNISLDDLVYKDLTKGEQK
ncbi:MAG TPA: helix-turn-helix transcriptional regulator, partial [Candidatus Pelethenecus sp.]|nr:helix-turn-helix transcriptional regulator [Candidatus Pelethenecus sp.]